MDVLIDRYRACRKIPVRLLPRIYKKTSENSPIRRWMVLLFARFANLKSPECWYDENVKDYSLEFLMAVIRELDRWRTEASKGTHVNAEKLQLNHSDYHVQPQEGRVASRTAPSEDNHMQTKIESTEG